MFLALYFSASISSQNIHFLSKSVFTPFLYRIVGAAYSDAAGVNTPISFPSTKYKVPTAHQVSNQFFKTAKTNNGGNRNKFSVLHTTFGQFLDHDITEMAHVSDSCAQIPR